VAVAVRVEARVVDLFGSGERAAVTVNIVEIATAVNSSR
jgi:hypothetical protein